MSKDLESVSKTTKALIKAFVVSTNYSNSKVM